MTKLTIPRHWPWVDFVGLAVTALVCLVPAMRIAWLLHLCLVLYVYSAFWGLVDLYQRGLLNKRVAQIYQAVSQSPRRSRFEHAAFILAGAIFTPWSPRWV